MKSACAAAVVTYSRHRHTCHKKDQTSCPSDEMDIDVVGNVGTACLKLRIIQATPSPHKKHSGDLTAYSIDSLKSPRLGEFGKYNHCLVAARRDGQSSGHHESGERGLAWSNMTSLERIHHVNTTLRESPRYCWICSGIELYGSTGSLTYALLPVEHSTLCDQVFCLSKAEVRKAGRGLMMALTALHSINLVHSNVSVDAVRYDSRRDEFVLTDLFCMSSMEAFDSTTCGCTCGRIVCLLGWTGPQIYQR